MNRPYVIVAPPWNRMSGGGTALFRFCHELNERGQEAYVIEKNTGNDWNTPFISYRDTLNLVHGEGIVVYPEVVKGNPYIAKRVVRFILNTPGRLGGDAEHPESEMKFSWSPIYSDADPLWVNLIEMDLFKDEGLERNGEVYFIGKGKRDFKGTEIVPVGKEISKLWPTKRDELAQIFKTSTLFHSYDACTALNVEATLCGCPVIVYPSDRISKEDWYAKERSRLGVAFGIEELEKAKSELPLARETYLKTMEQIPLMLDNFIIKTQWWTL